MSGGDAESLRLRLYRRAARRLNRFCERWTIPFCANCLQVTARHHRGDPRADVELLQGIFPGCCHAGVGDALWMPGSEGEEGFSEELREDMTHARGDGAGDRDPERYWVRERGTGLRVEGVACVHLVRGRCLLGELKSPLCLCYVCDPVRDALAAAAGRDVPGEDADDFCGSREALRAVVAGRPEDAEAAVERLELRLEELDAALRAAAGRTGRTPYRRWARAAETPA